jgi:hypothetical protein
MTFESCDPREALRQVITTDADLFQDGSNERVITITDSSKNVYQIPIYLTEFSKSDILPPLPLIELGLLNETSTVQDIGASTRKHEAIIDINIYWQKMDGVEQDKFGKLIADELCKLIRINQCNTVPKTHFITVTDTGRVLTESYAKQVVYHRVMEVYVLWYDRP